MLEIYFPTLVGLLSLLCFKHNTKDTWNDVRHLFNMTMKLNINPHDDFLVIENHILNMICFTSIFSRCNRFYQFFISFRRINETIFSCFFSHLSSNWPQSQKQQCPSQHSERKSFYTSSTFSSVSLFGGSFWLPFHYIPISCGR